jgi:hypothetical protein
MVIYMRANGSMTWPMDLACTPILMGQVTKDNGNRISNMAKVKRFGLMAQHTKELIYVA